MIGIDYQTNKLPENLVNKQQIATQQMEALLKLVESKSKAYALLSPIDKQSLLKQGYAQDLVDNLVYGTEQIDLEKRGQAADSQFVAGFTAAAFDASIYSCTAIKRLCQKRTSGRCIYCETQLNTSCSGLVIHHFPVWGVSDTRFGAIRRPGYYQKAYMPDNLMFACKACAIDNKGAQFPIHTGKPLPVNWQDTVNNEIAVATDKEAIVLVNPYSEDPRQYIRFNPLNGKAFAYDSVIQFYREWKNKSMDEVEQDLWANPQNIPHQSIGKTVLSDPGLDTAFSAWKKYQQNSVMLTRGETTIDVLGLNRKDLVRARCLHLYQLRSQFLTGNIKYNCYLSLSEDAQETWKIRSAPKVLTKYENAKDKGPSDLWQIYLLDGIDSDNSDNLEQTHTEAKKSTVSPWMQSSLAYLITEQESKIQGKRRLICLHSLDRVYGSLSMGRAMLEQVDWDKDFNCAITVNSESGQWKTCFTELLETEPLSLIALFAKSELWVEGEFTACSKKS